MSRGFLPSGLAAGTFACAHIPFHLPGKRSGPAHETVDVTPDRLLVGRVAPGLERIAIAVGRPNPWLPHLVGTQQLDRCFHGFALPPTPCAAAITLVTVLK